MPRLTFEGVVTGAIVANTAVLVWSVVDHMHTELVDHVEHAITFVFVAELVIRLAETGWNPGRFCRKPWNVFDTLVIGLALLPVLPVGVMLARTARLARLLHLGRHGAQLRVLRLAKEGVKA